MVLGVAWYREADWPRIKELFPDDDELHDTHAEWVKSAEASVKRLTRPGVTVEPYTTWGATSRDVRRGFKVILIRTLSRSFCSRTT